MNFIDLFQHGQIATARNKAEKALNQSDLLRLEIQDLQRKLDAHTIACHALWEILREKHGIGDFHIVARRR